MLTVAKALAFVFLALKLAADVQGQTACTECNVAECENETTVQKRCPDAELVTDPCGCCKICGKKVGEVCGGSYGYLGTCVYDKNVFCTANSSEYLLGVNISGICTSEYVILLYKLRWFSADANCAGLTITRF